MLEILCLHELVGALSYCRPLSVRPTSLAAFTCGLTPFSRAPATFVLRGRLLSRTPYLRVSAICPHPLPNSHYHCPTEDPTVIAMSPTRLTTATRPCHVRTISIVTTDRPRAPQVRHTSPLLCFEVLYLFQYFSHISPPPSGLNLG